VKHENKENIFRRENRSSTYNRRKENIFLNTYIFVFNLFLHKKLQNTIILYTISLYIKSINYYNLIPDFSRRFYKKDKILPFQLTRIIIL